MPVGLEDFALTEEEQKQLEEGVEEEKTEEQVEENQSEAAGETPVEEKAEGEEKPHEEPVVEDKEKTTEPKETKRVPLAELIEERKHRQALQAEVGELKTKFQTVDQLKDAILKLKEERMPVKEPEPIVTYEEDPLGYTYKKVNEIDENQKVIKQNMEYQQFIGQVVNLENQFRTKQPDYDSAYQYVVDTKIKELAEVGITDPADVAREIQRVSYSLSTHAMQKGKNPAEVVYSIAKTYGYKQPSAKPEEQSKANAEETIKSVAKGQQMASKTLSGSGKSETPKTVEALLEANGDEFDRLWKEMFG